MIKTFVDAWDKNNKLLLKDFETKCPESYQDILEQLVNKVINPYLEEKDLRVLNYENMTTIDNGDYQGTTIYIIFYETYQPDVEDYVFTHNYYGSCSGCDTFEGIYLNYDDLGNAIPTKEAAKEYWMIALHLLQNFKVLGSNEDI